jgi:HSP20 family protein
MAGAATKLPIKSETRAPSPRRAEPAGLEGFWNEMERLFDTFGFRSGRHPFASAPSFDLSLPRFERWGSVPAVDVSKTDNLYEITAELPGMAPADVQVKLSEGVLTISGEKKARRSGRTRTPMYPSAAMVPSSVHFACPTISPPTRLTRTSPTAS